MKISDLTAKLTGERRRWRAYRARVQQLSPAYRTAARALERYLMFTGPTDDGNLMVMLEDLVDLFEQSEAGGTPVRQIVGDDPVEFAEAFKRNYGVGAWFGKEHQRLLAAIEQAERSERSSS